MPSPRYWRERGARLRLEAARCGSCERVMYPPRRRCPECGSGELETVELTRRGAVLTSTVIHVPPTDLTFEGPYAMAIVETPEGARLTVQVVDCDPQTVVPGTEVELELRLIRREGHSGILCYGHKGVPVAQSG